MDLAQAKQKVMDKYCLTEGQLEENALFVNVNGDYFVAIDFASSGNGFERCLYFIECSRLNDFSTIPTLQIKYQTNQLNKNINKGDFFVRRLEYVDYSFKGKGYASVFMDVAKEFAKQMGCKNIVGELIPLHGESSEKVEHFYRKNNFEIATREDGQQVINFAINNNKTYANICEEDANCLEL